MSLQTIILNGSAEVTLGAFVYSASGGVETSGTIELTGTKYFIVKPTGAQDDILSGDHPGIEMRFGTAKITRGYSYEAVPDDILLSGDVAGTFGKVYEAIVGVEPTLSNADQKITGFHIFYTAKNPFAGGIQILTHPSSFYSTVVTKYFIYEAIPDLTDNILMSGDAYTFFVTAPYHIIPIGGITLNSSAIISDISYNYIASGGISINGSAPIGRSYTPTSFDSIIMGGGVSLHLSYTPTAFDSIVLDGTSPFGIGIISTGIKIDIEDSSANLTVLSGISYHYNASGGINISGSAPIGRSYTPTSFDSIVMGGDAEESFQPYFLYTGSGIVTTGGLAYPGWHYKSNGEILVSSSAILNSITYNYNALPTAISISGQAKPGIGYIPTYFDSIVISGEGESLFALSYEAVPGLEVKISGNVIVNHLTYRYRPKGLLVTIGGKPGLKASYNYNVVLGDLSIIVNGKVIPKLYKFKEPKPPWARFVMLEKQIQAAKLNQGLEGLPEISDFRIDHQPGYCLAGREKEPLEPCLSEDGSRSKGAWIPAVVAERQNPYLPDPNREYTSRERRYVK